MNPRLFAVLTVSLLTYSATLALETETLFDGTNSRDWSTARDDERLKREFSLSELVAMKDPAALHWRFVSRDIGYNDLFLISRSSDVSTPSACESRTRANRSNLP